MLRNERFDFTMACRCPLGNVRRETLHNELADEIRYSTSADACQTIHDG